MDSLKLKLLLSTALLAIPSTVFASTAIPQNCPPDTRQSGTRLTTLPNTLEPWYEMFEVAETERAAARSFLISGANLENRPNNPNSGLEKRLNH